MGTHIEHITVLLFCNLPWPINVILSPSYASAPRTPSHASSAHSPGAQTLPPTALAIPRLIRPFLLNHWAVSHDSAGVVLAS